MTSHAADPGAEHAKGLLGRLVVVAIHVGLYRTIARNESANVIESSRQLSETADVEPENRPRACPPPARTTKRQI